MGLLKKILTILTLSCDGAAYYLSKAQEAPLTRTERWALRMHLLVCTGCRRYKRHLLFLRELIRSAAQKAYDGQTMSGAMSPERAQRVMRNIASNLPDAP